jgi:hypothetical protein
VNRFELTINVEGDVNKLSVGEVGVKKFELTINVEGDVNIVERTVVAHDS